MSEMSTRAVMGGSYGTLSNNRLMMKRTDESKSHLLIDELQRFRSDTPYQDKMFAILFAIFLLLITILSIYFYVQNEDTFDSDSTNTNNEFLNKYFWKLVIISLVISVFNSILMLIIARKFTHFLIVFTQICSLLLLTSYGFIVIFSFGSLWVGICIFIAAFIELIWIFVVRNNIEFTTALMILSIEGLNTYLSTYFVSLAGIILQTIWLIIWCMGFAYSIDGTESTEVAIVLYIIAYYWTCQVITNACYTTICGSVGTWYFLHPKQTPSYPVYNSFQKSITTSFGSICYGSLIIAVIQTIKIFINIFRAMIRERRHNHSACIRCMTACISGFTDCIKNVTEYINCMAFARTAIYGMNYCQSAKQTMHLFTSRGFDSIITDDLTNSVLILSCILCSSFTGAIIGVISKYSYNNNSIETIVLWSLTAFAICFAISMSVIVTIKAAVCTIFVCFAEDPAVLSFTKPLKYDQLTKAWNKRYGQLPKKLTNPPRNI
eukprot:539478_1